MSAEEVEQGPDSRFVQLIRSDFSGTAAPAHPRIVFIILCLFTGALSGALASSFVLCHRPVGIVRCPKFRRIFLTEPFLTCFAH